MKVAESWLREWVDPSLSTDDLAHNLTMLGHEVDGVSVEGEGLDGVVVGEVLSVAKHPDADRLSVCQVATGAETLEIVCGASNVRAGLKTAFAPVGVTLPNGLKLRKSKIRGVVSNGMLCSATELGLGEDADGIMELPESAKAGEALTDVLSLPDAVIEVDLTPNRGDCFSILGLARDVSVVTGAELRSAEVDAVAPSTDDKHAVKVANTEHCPSFAGRVIRGIDPAATAPLWMVEKLRRAGLRPIHPVVDVTNYVMLELGQPCHAYDLDKLQGTICPRLALPSEKVHLLDDKVVEPDGETLVIADDSGAIGLAGIMGGASTAVSVDTVNIFYEAAFWPQSVIAGRARRYGMHTDASLRFERGVDPTGQVRAVERATALILEICGGEAGPTVHYVDEARLPARQSITLRRERLDTLLGVHVEDDVVTSILERLGLEVDQSDDGWSATPPSHRFDLAIEVDLIEEIARIHGYEAIPETTALAAAPLAPSTETIVTADTLADALVARDYREAITYSFVDAELDAAYCGVASRLALSNPISSEMSVMRGSLVPGLAQAAAANVARQQDRVRMFETGRSYHGEDTAPVEISRIAGIAIGSRVPEQWGASGEKVDFFDVKADVEALVKLTGQSDSFRFEASTHPALQPGQTARILRGDADVGVLGKLHPAFAKRLGLKPAAYVFEIDLKAAFATRAPSAETISRYPAIRRDIAVVVDESVPAAALTRAVAEVAPDIIKRVHVFDIYTGTGVEAGRKSVAIGLILQETSRTLTDDDADSATARAVQKLQEEYAAQLRD